MSVYTIPTETPEADGTLAWDATSLVVVEPHTRGGTAGLGYAFGDTATGTVVRDLLAGVVVGLDVRDTPGAWEAMVRSIRNLGRPGICSMAIAAVDIALWDTKARCAEQPLFRLLGAGATQSRSTAVAALPLTASSAWSNSSAAGWSRGFPA